MMLAASAGVIACAIVALMVWRVGWADDEPKKAAASPARVEAASPASSDAAAAPQEEILEFARPDEPLQSRPKPAMSSAKNVVVSASTKTDVSPYVGGLAIYNPQGKLIYGAPIPDPNAPAAKKEPLKAETISPKPAARAAAPNVGATGHLAQLSSDAAGELLTTRIEPDYPDAARRAHIQGTVTVDTVVSSDGKVLEASAISGNPQLSDAAVAAVRQWQYKPYTLKGKKSGFRTQVPVTFMLAQ